MDSTHLHASLIGYSIDDLHVGMSALFAKTITESDIVLYAGLTGDLNPVHVNQEYAKQTRFKGRIAHGMLTASLFSTVLGTKMPGPGCIYLSQELKFLAPVYAGDTVTAKVMITEIISARKRVICRTTATVGDTIVCDGVAKMMVQATPE
ncbi:MAG: MaoC family dehydratase [Pseudomonadota bacterium]